MADSKIAIYLSLFTLLTTCSAVQFQYPHNNQPRVLIEKVDNMSPSQQADAADFLKAIYGNNAADNCKGLRDAFAEKYKEEVWSVVLYKAYSINSLKSIQLKVGDDHYLLFATKK